jgi:hypothetical protein
MRRPPDRSCSNPPDRPLLRRLGRLTILAAAILAWLAAALAQSPWEQAGANLETSFTAPLARSLVLLLLLSLMQRAAGPGPPIVLFQPQSVAPTARTLSGWESS